MAVMLTHPEHYEDRNRAGIYSDILKYVKSKNVWIATLKEVDDWWRYRTTPGAIDGEDTTTVELDRSYFLAMP
jgi:hypothetical protein